MTQHTLDDHDPEELIDQIEGGHLPHDLLAATADETRHNLNESADKIRLKTQLVRGEGTRDQDKIEVKVRGDDPDDAVDALNDVLANLRATADAARQIQPTADDAEEGDDGS